MKKGQVLSINLASQSVDTKEISKEVMQKYYGGRGLGAYLYNQNPLAADDKKNSVFIVPGYLTGTLFPSASRSKPDIHSISFKLLPVAN